MTLTFLSDGYAILHEQSLLGESPRYTLLRYNRYGDGGHWEQPDTQPSQETLARAVELQMLTPELLQHIASIHAWKRHALSIPVDAWLIGARFEFEPLLRRTAHPLALVEGGYVVVGKRYIDGDLQRVSIPYLGRFERGRGKRVSILIAQPQPWEPSERNPQPLDIRWLYRALHYGKLSAPLRRWIRAVRPEWTPLEP
ncbi:MAG: hypothetical protein NZ556_04895 [Fimbriimonadales bacterium]|nr:hypothetical protein [Fimbriimonadales bacterium]